MNEQVPSPFNRVGLLSVLHRVFYRFQNSHNTQRKFTSGTLPPPLANGVQEKSAPPPSAVPHIFTLGIPNIPVPGGNTQNVPVIIVSSAQHVLSYRSKPRGVQAVDRPRSTSRGSLRQ